jgi:hypothetical protein
VSQRGECPICRKVFHVTVDGAVRQHRASDRIGTCPGSQQAPAKLVTPALPDIAPLPETE